MRTHIPFSISLHPDMAEAVDVRAASLGFRRATYVQQLIREDLKKWADEQKLELDALMKKLKRTPKKGRSTEKEK